MNGTAWVGLTLLGACVLANHASAGVLDPTPAPVTRSAYVGEGAFASAPTSDYRRSWRGDYERRSYRRRSDDVQGWFDIRGGFFDTQDVAKNDWTVGVKGMGKVTPELSLGVSTDLHRRTHADRIVTSQYTDPTGHVVTTSSTALDAESNLVPVMGVLELHVPSVGVDPYLGAAAGWEFLNVRVRDFSTGFEDDANYDGPGYQVFGGIGFPVGDRARFVTEAFWNGSTVSRDVRDVNSGFEVQERVDVNGFGARGGLSFAF